MTHPTHFAGDVEEDGDKKEAKEDEGEAAGEARFDLWIARSHSRSDPEWTDVLMLATAAISGWRGWMQFSFSILLLKKC